MADEEYKLSQFQAAVFAEIDLKTSQIKQEAEEYKEQELEKNKDLQLDQSYNFIQKKSQEIKQQCKREVAKYSLDAKRSLLIKRNEITQRVFDNIRAKLLQFSESENYKQYLVDSVKAFAKANPNCQDVEILLKANDMAFEKDVKKAFSAKCTVVESNDIKLGGFIVRDANNSKYDDETLEQKMQDQKTYFMANSKLSISAQ